MLIILRVYSFTQSKRIIDTFHRALQFQVHTATKDIQNTSVVLKSKIPAFTFWISLVNKFYLVLMSKLHSVRWLDWNYLPCKSRHVYTAFLYFLFEFAIWRTSSPIVSPTVSDVCFVPCAQMRFRTESTHTQFFCMHICVASMSCFVFAYTSAFHTVHTRRQEPEVCDCLGANDHCFWQHTF